MADGAATFEWRGDFTNYEVNALHAEGFHHPVLEVDWLTQLERHSLGWVCARSEGRLVGFVNVAWDGGMHAFVLDTLVDRNFRRRGIGTELVAVAHRESRAQGCEWLHVDFEDELTTFYLRSCGFTTTSAGAIRLAP
jgi:ribosomal protein S18 acetylase RimI-like enzyme